MKGLFCGIFVGTALLSASAAPAASLTSMYAVSRVTQTINGKPLPSHLAKTWSKNEKIRMEDGQIVLIMDGKNQYLFPVKNPKKEMQVRSLPAAQRPKTALALYNLMYGMVLKKGRKEGTAKILGHATSIYELPSGAPGQSTRMWIASDVGAPIPLRAEMKNPQMSVINETITFQVNPSLPDSMFAPPPGYKRMTPPVGRPPVAMPPKKK